MKITARLAAQVDNRDYARGPKTAPVTIVEYADYECPDSAKMYYTLRRLGSEIGETFRLIFRNFPLTQIRPRSLQAALAAEAVGMQGTFWEMHDILYEHRDGLEPEHLIVYAQVLGLDIERFIVDLTSDAAAESVREDFVSGLHSGVNGTPTLYINGVRYDGGLGYRALKSAIVEAAKSRTQRVSKAQSIIARGHGGLHF